VTARADVTELLREAMRQEVTGMTVTDPQVAVRRLEHSVRRTQLRRRLLAASAAAAAVAAVVTIGVLTAGSDHSAEPLPAGPTQPALPPPGHRIVVAGNPDVLVLSDRGGPAVPVLRGTEPRFSPDSRQVAFVDVDQRLAVATVGEWRPAPLTEAPGPDAGDGDVYGPIWSTDGRQIAYMHRSELRTVDATGGAPRLVKAFSAPYVRPMEWLPDGSLLLGFDRTEEGGSLVVERLDLTTGRLAPYLDGEGETTGVRFSPDRTRIAFYSDSLSCICTADPDGSDISVILPFALGESPDSARLAWSPDGTQLVWDERFTGYIHLLDVATGRDRLLQDGVSARAGAIDWDRP
jgi:hypothetical protein